MFFDTILQRTHESRFRVFRNNNIMVIKLYFYLEK